MTRTTLPRQSISAGSMASAMQEHRAAADRAASGLWRRDPSVWSADEAVKKTIANRLGWLSSPEVMKRSLERLSRSVGSWRNDGFTDAVLLGMGGSSLAPEVLRAILGIAPGGIRLHVLDSTDPAAVRAVSTVAQRTLFILASKSGSTLEPNALAAHFRRVVEAAGIQ